MSKLAGVAAATVVGFTVVALVARVGEWAYLKTRLPEKAFIDQRRDSVSGTSEHLAAQPSQRESIFLLQLATAAEVQASRDVSYDPSYVALDFPSGDVDPDKGVCTDLVVRAYRDIGVDLQLDVNEDMQSNFDAYPSRRIWGSKGPDSSIDHRRVPNLMALFERHGQSLPVTDDPAHYQPGDVVTWHLGGGLTHIGIVTSQLGPEPDRRLVAHHVGGPPSLDDSLLRWEIIGHYRYFGDALSDGATETQ